MDFRNKTTIINRFNDSIHAAAMFLKAERNNDTELIRTHKANFSRAVYETFENGLKNHIANFGDSNERRNIKSLDIDQLFKIFRNCKTPIEDGAVEDVDLNYLIEERKIVNKEKHELNDAVYIRDFEKHISELRKFILTYIDDNKQQLKKIEDFENLDLPSWDKFYTICNQFEKEDRNFVLIIGRNQNLDREYLTALAIPKWDLIIDFDYRSREDGFYNKAYAEKTPEPHILKPNDYINSETFSTYATSHYHYFIKGYLGSGITGIDDYDSWGKYERGFEKLVENFTAKFDLNTKVIIVSEDISDEFLYNILRIFRKNFKEKAEFILALNDKSSFDFSINKFKPSYIPISIPEISEGLVNYCLNCNSENPFKDKYILPFLESTDTKGVTGIISPETFAELEEDFEVLHKGISHSNISIPEDRRDFLCGFNTISWNGIKERFDVERQNFNRIYVRPILKAIENATGKISLVHEAGYGGTTIGRRIAWEIHNEYPTLILKKYRDSKTIDKIVQLHTLTRKTIFVVMEVPQALSIDEVEFFYKSIPKTRPVVFLVVRRGKPNTTYDLPVSDWGNNCIDLINAYRPYLKEYNNSAIEIEKEKEFERILTASNTEGYKRTPFYIGLVTFDEKFFGIKSYIRNFVNEVLNKDDQKRSLLYLALCHDYLGQGLPATFFASIFNQSLNGGNFKLENNFSTNSSITNSLLISYSEGKQKFWQPRHVLFSREIKEQLLGGGDSSEMNWKRYLADYCIRFIEDSVSEGQTSEYIQEILQKLFIGTRRERAGETFTNIVNDAIIRDDQRRIINQEKIEGIFKCLKESYPENPHYCSHLARFYAYKYKNRELALKYADEAIRLSEVEDPLLYHIKGMCLREAAYDLMKQLEENKRRGIIVPESEYSQVIDNLIPQAAREFEISRIKSKEQNKTDEHGYIAHIQMLIRGIDFGSIILGKPKSKLIEGNIDPFSEWLDLAESLLEDVIRHNHDNDDNGKIAQCQDGLHEIYENYDLILQSLRNQLDKGKNLSRLRRQIVRTYFKKEDINLKSNPRIIRNILELMEKNIENEPNNERNFYLWFQAARYSNEKIEDAISKLGSWKANSSTIDSLFYFYVLKVLRAIQGYSEDAIFAERLIKECKAKGKGNTKVLEWYGKGHELNKLVSPISLEEFEKEDKLERVRGYVTAFNHQGDASITIANKLEVYFSPTKAGLTEDILGKEVDFYLGFSHDGLRADSFSVQRVLNANKITKTTMNFSNLGDLGNEEQLVELAAKISEQEVLGETNVGNQIRVTKTNIGLKEGSVVDLKYPPRYVMGNIEGNDGKEYFFHKDNERKEVFDNLKIGTNVLFEVGMNGSKEIAINLQIIE